MAKKLIVVVHLIDEPNKSIEARTVEQVKIAFENGADGVFLTPAIIVSKNKEENQVIKCYRAVRDVFSDEFIGINFMEYADTVVDFMEYIATNPNQVLPHIWVDFGIGRRAKSDNVRTINRFLRGPLTTDYYGGRQRGQRGIDWKGLMFGGFYFKGNNDCISFSNISDEVLEQQARESSEIMDVLVTSGKGTGISIDTDILKRLYELCSKLNLQLGLASGISVDNIDDCVKYADYFIVGTGVERTSTDPNTIAFYREARIPSAVDIGFLDKNKIKKLADKIHK